VAIQPDAFPIKGRSTVVCYPSFVPATEKGADKIPTVVPDLKREDRLYPVEVPACATFDDMVIVTSNVMGCPCLLRTDTRFPLKTNDHVIFASEQDVHLEQMTLKPLRAEDEIILQ
jgi:hypothetical protein